MVVGIDVNHAAPGSSNASFAAIVFSLDEECVCYHTVVEEQTERSEPIANLESKMHLGLRAYIERNGAPPKRILVYRDGVAHNMFDDITRKEIAIIRRAGTTLGNTTGNYVPQVNFIVSQMRTKARFAHYRNDKKSGRDAPRDDWWNLKPGTVIDSGITEAGLDNFYLVSAKALQGTARAPHYHVLENDSQFSLDELQRFTFDLCVLYARCTKIVGRPAPVYYAHRAASFGPYYDGDYRDGAIEWDAVSSSSGGSGNRNEKRNISAVREELRGALYYA